MIFKQNFNASEDKLLFAVTVTPTIQPDNCHVCSLMILPITSEKIDRAKQCLDIKDNSYEFYKFCILLEKDPFDNRGELTISSHESIDRINEIFEMYNLAFKDETHRENLNCSIADMTYLDSFDELYKMLKNKNYVDYSIENELNNFEYGKEYVDDNGFYSIPDSILSKCIDYELLGYNLRKNKL